MFDGQYTGKRVFITGHTGFKGFWLSSWLLDLGAQVGGFSDGVPSSPSGFQAVDLQSAVQHFQGDIRDSGAITRAMQQFQPDIVFHMAAQALVRPSYASPADTFAVNAMGTLHTLEAVRATPSVQAVVCITSDKCYRNNEWVWGYRETDHLGGEDPYSASKACAEIIAQSYFRSFLTQNIKKATVRAGNVIGGGDWATDRIVPDCARAWAAGQPVTIRSPYATRPWQHVLEPLSGYLWLGALFLSNRTFELPLDGEAFNFGPAADINATVAEVADTLAAHWPGFSALMDRDSPRTMKECTLLKLCCDKALAHMQWKATLSFTETIRFTALWYKEYYQCRNTSNSSRTMASFTLDQIHAYQSRAAQSGVAWAHNTSGEREI